MFSLFKRKTKIPFEEKYSEDFGRYLVASEDIRAGQLMFREPPLFVFSEFSDFPWDGEHLVCSCCYRVISIMETFSCKYCDWLMCSKECTKNPSHRKFECDIFRKQKVKMTSKTVQYLFLYRWFLIRKREKDKKEKMAKLNSEIPMGERNSGYFSKLDEFATNAAEFLNGICRMFVTEEEIKKLMNTLKVNSFSVIYEDYEDYEERCCVVYATSCLILHSCASNTEFAISSHSTGRHMELYSRVPISKGEKITVFYGPDVSRMGMCQRIQTICSRFGFICKCERCLDPTELGTNYSTLKCPECRKGFLYPFTGSLRYDDYSCHSCSICLPIEEVTDLEDSFAEELEDVTKWGDENSQLEKLEYLISSATSCYGLHPNHFLVQKAIFQWLPFLDENILLEDTEESFETYNSIRQRADAVLETLRIFGIDSILQIQLEVLLVQTIIRFHFKNRNYSDIVQDFENAKNNIKIIRLVLRHLRRGIKASRIFSLDYRRPVEGILDMYNQWTACLADCQSQLGPDEISLGSEDSSIRRICSN